MTKRAEERLVPVATAGPLRLLADRAGKVLVLGPGDDDVHEPVGRGDRHAEATWLAAADTLGPALRDARERTDADTLVVAVPPLARLLPASLATCGLPLVLVPPLLGRAADLGPLEAAAAASGHPVTVLGRAGLDPLLPKAIEALACVAGPGWDELDLEFVVPIAASLRRATESASAHDAFVATLADVLALLHSRGIAPDAVRVDTELSPSYWYRAEFSFADVRTGLRGKVSLHHWERDASGAPPSGLVRLGVRKGAAEVTCARKADGATFRISSATANAERAVPVAACHTEGPLGVVARAARSSGPRLPLARYAALWSTADALAQQYLYGHVVALRRVERKALAGRVGTLGELTVDASLAPLRESGSGFELVPGEVATSLLRRPLERELRVLLVRAPESNAFDARFPPLALARLAAMARGLGAVVNVVDLALDAGEALERCGNDGDARREALGGLLRAALADLAARFDAVGVSLNDATTWPHVGPSLVEIARRTGVPFVLGGRASGRVPPEAFAGAEAVWVVAGEGEVPFAAFLHAVAARRAPVGVPGLGLAAEPGPLGALCVQTDFASLPTPDFAGFDLGRYRSHTRALAGPFLPLLFQRGCRHTCTFCADDSSREVRARPVARVVDDLVQLVARHGVRDFYFLNNLINSDRAYLEALLAALNGASLGLSWVDCARVTGLDRPLLEAMRAAGCRQLTFGVDAGCDRLLTLTRKGFTVAEAERAIRETRAAGIDVVVNLIVGLPHETDADFDLTRAFVARVREHVADFLVMPYHYTPGSALFNDPARYGLKRRGLAFDVVNGPTAEEHAIAIRARVATLMRDVGHNSVPERFFQEAE